jgi:hypothetical protein
MSLFPFLAVLICTMGALILLLIVIARQARVQAAQAAAAKAEQSKEDLTADLSMVRWRIEQLQQSRAKTQDQLSEARLQLGQIEDHARRLARQLDEIEKTAAHLEAASSAGSPDRELLKQQLAQLQHEVSAAEKALDDERRRVAQQNDSYAIIPYQGPHQTHRRPIYIECREDSIIVQPEGIELRPADFQGPAGPGNPLASAMRAIREYLVSQPGYDVKKDGEPYPLLLVRPGGVVAYAQARAALESWGSEFGYELIEEDWDLDYRPPDPSLAEVAQQAVDVARVRQRRLIAAAPRSYGRGGSGGAGGASSDRPVYRVSPSGGVMLDRGSPEPTISRRRHRRPGLASNDPDVPSHPADRSPEGRGTDSAGPDGLPGPTLGDPSGSRPETSPTTARYGEAYRNSADATANPYSDSGAASGSQGKPNLAAGSPREHHAPGKGNSAEARPGMWTPGQKAAEAEGSAATSAAADATTECPLAESRGRDWGLPEGGAGSVPITRPVRIDCHADRFVLVPERGSGRPREIALDGPTRKAVDELVSAIWDYMDTWGIAGRGMYWKPVLSVHVASGGQSRFNDLKALLEDSGLEVRQAH